MPSRHDKFIGCLLGGAVGDALGAPVEFLSDSAIREAYGPAGIRDYDQAFGRLGAITDDTQMTLFTAEGLLRAYVRGAIRGIWHPPTMVHHAYLRWLVTQLGNAPFPYHKNEEDGWLIKLPALHSQRAPGNTCLSALMTGKCGTPAKPLNDSKGCGGVMRVAPVGLMFENDPKRAFELGCEIAAITHGHPTGYTSAGYLAALIAKLVAGTGLLEAMAASGGLLGSIEGYEEVQAAVDEARALAGCGKGAELLPRLGAGWVAEEALAISLYCCLVAANFEEAVVLAVNHSGDSDSTGAITGNIMGAMLGQKAIPERWADGVELRDEIIALARDLAELTNNEPWPDNEAAICARYPPY